MRIKIISLILFIISVFPAMAYAYNLASDVFCIAGGSCNSATYKLTRSVLGGDLTDATNSATVKLKAGFIVVANAQTNNTNPPNPPTVNTVTTPTANSIQALSGTKDANTSIWINGIEKVPIDALTAWSCNYNLTEGQNDLSIASKKSNGTPSSSVPVSIFLDTSPPSTPVVTDEGITTIDLTRISANWTSSDPQTGIIDHEYSIGTTPTGADVVSLTSTGTLTSVTKTGLNLTPGQIYYVSVRAKNGAGGWSSWGTSDGIYGKNAEPQIDDIGLTEGGRYYSNSIPLTIIVTDSDDTSFQYQYSIAASSNGRFKLRSFALSGGGGTSVEGNYIVKEGTIAEALGSDAQVVGYKLYAGYIPVYKKMLELINQTPSTVVQTWTPLNTYTLNLDNEPPGRKVITVQVKDSHGGQTSKQIEIFVYRRPISPPQP